MQMPLGDEFSTSKEQLLARIDVCMGGKVAEELIMGNDKVGNRLTAPTSIMCSTYLQAASQEGRGAHSVNLTRCVLGSALACGPG